MEQFPQKVRLGLMPTLASAAEPRTQAGADVALAATRAEDVAGTSSSADLRAIGNAQLKSQSGGLQVVGVSPGGSSVPFGGTSENPLAKLEREAPPVINRLLSVLEAASSVEQQREAIVGLKNSMNLVPSVCAELKVGEKLMDYINNPKAHESLRSLCFQAVLENVTELDRQKLERTLVIPLLLNKEAPTSLRVAAAESTRANVSEPSTKVLVETIFGDPTTPYEVRFACRQLLTCDPKNIKHFDALLVKAIEQPYKVIPDDEIRSNPPDWMRVLQTYRDFAPIRANSIVEGLVNNSSILVAERAELLIQYYSVRTAENANFCLGLLEDGSLDSKIRNEALFSLRRSDVSPDLARLGNVVRNEVDPYKVKNLLNCVAGFDPNLAGALALERIKNLPNTGVTIDDSLETTRRYALETIASCKYTPAITEISRMVASDLQGRESVRSRRSGALQTFAVIAGPSEKDLMLNILQNQNLDTQERTAVASYFVHNSDAKIDRYFAQLLRPNDNPLIAKQDPELIRLAAKAMAMRGGATELVYVDKFIRSLPLEGTRYSGPGSRSPREEAVSWLAANRSPAAYKILDSLVRDPGPEIEAPRARSVGLGPQTSLSAAQSSVRITAASILASRDDAAACEFLVRDRSRRALNGLLEAQSPKATIALFNCLLDDESGVAMAFASLSLDSPRERTSFIRCLRHASTLVESKSAEAMRTYARNLQSAESHGINFPQRFNPETLNQLMHQAASGPSRDASLDKERIATE